MHSLLKHKMQQLTVKISLYMGPCMFRSVRTICTAVCVLGAMRRATAVTCRPAPSTHTAVQTKAHIATAQQQF
jgi:hypothetical protein